MQNSNYLLKRALSLFFFTTLMFPMQLCSMDGTSSNKLIIASLSIMPEKWNKKTNYQKIEKMVRQATEKGADLIVAPEGVLEGYVIGHVKRSQDLEKAAARFFDLAEPLDGEYILKFQKLAKELNVYLCIGFAQRLDTLVYNSAALMNRIGEIIGVYQKNHRAQKFYIPAFYFPGNDIPVFDTEFGKVGIMICYDRQIPEVARCIALKGARLILNPSYGSTKEWNEALLRTRARDNGAIIVFTHPKQSLIVDESGTIIARSDGEDKILIKEICIPAKLAKSITRRRPELYDIIAQPNPLLEKP